MRLAVLFLTTILSLDSLAQSDGLAKYQDTVFIRYNKGWTKDILDYVTDTIVFETGMRRHILTGTAVLPWTHNQAAAVEYGINFLKVTKSGCQSNGMDFVVPFKDHINSILMTDSTLVVDFNLYDNCCYDFLCDLSVDKDGTLNLIYNGYGSYCACNCCFGLTYHMTIDNWREVSKIKSIMINGDRKTKKIIKKS